MRIIISLIFIVTLLTSGFAKRMPKIFPATKVSVPFENEWADTLGWHRYHSMREVSRAIEIGDLVPITTRCDRRLPKNRRYARPQTVLFVETLDREFYEATGGHLVVDSAIRPTDVQKRLRRWNRNAAPAEGASASSHERGTTVDLSRKMSKSRYRWLIVRLAYYQARQRIHIIEERGCFHIFVGEEPNDEETYSGRFEIDFIELVGYPEGSGPDSQLREDAEGHGPSSNRTVGTDTDACGEDFDSYPVGGYPADCPDWRIRTSDNHDSSPR